MLVGNGQSADGEVAPDVAAQALDLQLADLSEAQAREPRLDQQSRGRGQHPEAQQRRRQGHEQHRDEDHAERPAGGRPRPHPTEASRAPHRLSGRGVGALAQKLCPMLT